MTETYLDTLRKFRDKIHAEPDCLLAHYHLGLFFLKHQELGPALIQFNNVLTLNPDHLGALFYKGVLHIEENALQQAEEAFKAVLSLHGEHVEALVNMGVVALKQQQAQLAIDYFTKALALDNDHVEARNNLAATFIHHERFENALMHYAVLLEQSPDDREYLYNTGVAQMALGHLSEAITHFSHLLTLDPDHEAAHSNLAAIYLRLQKTSKALDHLQQAHVLNPANPSTQHLLAALRGHIPETQVTTGYANALFDHYASHYDNHMEKTLQYQLPAHVGTLLETLPTGSENISLDLGCGTGLAGSIVRPVSSHLTGVDISAKMLAQAAEKHVYDALIPCECLEFLENNTTAYTLITALDVLPYFGDLNPIFAAVSQHLTPNGYFIFTTEVGEHPPFQLQASARFNHTLTYLQECCIAQGLEIVFQKKTIARQQQEKPLWVTLIAARKK